MSKFMKKCCINGLRIYLVLILNLILVIYLTIPISCNSVGNADYPYIDLTEAQIEAEVQKELIELKQAALEYDESSKDADNIDNVGGGLP